MKSINNLTDNKPSNAIFAMIEGLKEQSEREDFKIKMLTFGNSDNNYCFGCAATCTIQKISGINLTKENINTEKERAEALGFYLEDLVNFENAIDSFRNGTDEIYNGSYYLLKYYGIEVKQSLFPDEHLEGLNSYDWFEKLQPYINYANKLKRLGL